MWGKCNNALIPQIAAPKYLRHDITGANNLMTSEQYRDLVGLGLHGESVKEFEYFLVAEADYVASIEQWPPVGLGTAVSVGKRSDGRNVVARYGWHRYFWFSATT